MRLAARPPARSPISLVPMIDVLMIMLVFFMVTSTYLDLDMIPMAERGEESAASAPLPGPGGADGRLLVRIGADGTAHFRGRTLAPEAVGDALAGTGVEEVLLLPSGAAPVQALVSVMDAIVAAGTRRVRIVRLEEAQ